MVSGAPYGVPRLFGQSVDSKWDESYAVTSCRWASAAVADGVAAWNPVFDVTPANLIDAIVTERGVAMVPNEVRMAALFGPMSSG